GQDALAAVSYTYHLFFPNGLYVIDPVSQSHRTMWHLWTLSVEEWFYLVIAGTVLFCVKQRLVRTLMVTMLAGFAAIGLARWLCYTGLFQDDPGMVAGVRMALLQRPDALMLGVAAACASALIDEERAERLRRPMLALATLSIGVWLLMLNTSSELVRKLGGPYFKYLPDCPELGYQLPKRLGGEVCTTDAFVPRSGMVQTMYWFRFGHTIGALAFAFIAFALVRYSDWAFSRFMSWGPFRWMGRMSYTLYVWHALPYLLIMALTGGEDASLTVQLLRTPVLIGAAFAVSLPVYYKVELPVLRAKMRFSSERQALDLTTGKMVDVPQPGSGEPPT
ncbi:MAG: acyltransferase family protein, partial [Actinomycetes bacterium]